MRHTIADATTTNAIGILLHHTNGNPDVWALAGRANVKARQEVMTALSESGKKATQAESGVNAIRKAIYDRLGIDEPCIAEDDSRFRKLCRILFPGLCIPSRSERIAAMAEPQELPVTPPIYGAIQHLKL